MATLQLYNFIIFKNCYRLSWSLWRPNAYCLAKCIRKATFEFWSNGTSHFHTNNLGKEPNLIFFLLCIITAILIKKLSLFILIFLVVTFSVPYCLSQLLFETYKIYMHLFYLSIIPLDIRHSFLIVFYMTFYFNIKLDC